MTQTLTKPTQTPQDVLDKVAAAITRMLNRAAQRNAWFATCALALKLRYRETTNTIATNGTYLWVGPRWFTPQPAPIQETAIAHEVLHCVLKHVYRLRGREPKLANVAADHVVNLLLLEDGWPLWPNAYADQRFRGLSFEEVYAILKNERDAQNPSPQPQPQPQPEEGDEDEDDQDADDQADQDDSDESDDGEEETEDDAEGEGDDEAGGAESDGDDSEGDESGGSGGGGQGDDDDEAEGGASGSGAGDQGEQDGDEQPGQMIDPDLPTGEDDDGGEGENGEGDGPTAPNTETDWDVIARQAQAVALRRGYMPGGVRASIVQSIEEEGDWRQELQDFIVNTRPHDYSWARPNRAFLWQGVYLPGTYKENIDKIVLVFDTSGSVFSYGILTRFVEHFRLIHEQCRPDAVEVVYCDSAVHESVTFGPDDEVSIETVKPKGGGGTTFQPAFDYTNAMDEPPACVLFLTDMEGENLSGHGPIEPDYPVLWVTTEAFKRHPVPFGRQIVIPEVERS